MNKPIGVFDSGLGGLTVLRELKRSLPGESFIYLGDNARAPYGPKGEKVINRYAHECAQFLLKHDVKIMVVACNTASAIALSDLEKELPIPVIGTIAPAVRAAVNATCSGSIAVIGTDATIASNAYQSALNQINPKLHITAFSCPLFVPLVECGMIDGEIVAKTVEHYLGRLKGTDVDTVILGCTHYPLLKGPIADFLGEGVNIVECSQAMTEDVKAKIKSHEGAKLPDKFFTTDDVGRFGFLAQYFLASQNLSVERANIE